MKFGRLDGGKWLDVAEAASVEEIQKRFAPALVAQWNAAGVGFSQCPANAEHGDIGNGDGTVTKPPIATPPARAAVLSATSFMDVAIAGLLSLGGTQAQAVARFQEIVEAARDFNDPNDVVLSRQVRYAHNRYSKADTFNKAVVSQLLLIFTDALICTTQERTAILAVWPNA